MAPRKTLGFTHDVVTIGAAVVDEYAASDRISIQHIAHAAVERYACVPLGAKLNLSSLLTGPGGGAVNTAVTCARLKLHTATIARVGTDLSGEYLRDFLRNARVDIRSIQQDTTQPTGKSLILKPPTGERTIFTYRGANARLDLSAIPPMRIRPRWFYVTSLNGHARQLATVLDYAETVGSRVMWNPGMEDLSIGLRFLSPLIQRVDILNLNREEAAFLAQQPPRHLPRIFHTLGTLPKLALLVSDGSKGAYLKGLERSWYCPALPGKRVDATGAGDALGSGFLAGYVHSCDLAIALQVGMLNALSVIRRPGATEGGLTRWPAGTTLRNVRLKDVGL